MAEPSHSMLEVTATEGVTHVRVSRPQAHNSLNPVVVHQLQQALAMAMNDPQVSGVVLGGVGSTFVMGADVSFFVRNIETGQIERILKFTETAHELLAAIEQAAKPVIALVEGPAAGGGVELALACHQIVATPKASFSFPETGIGIYPGMGGTQRLPRRIGVGLAKWLIYTGRTVPASEAGKLGLIDQLAAPADTAAACRSVIASRARWAPREMPSQRLVPDEFASLANWFTEHPAESIRQGNCPTEGDPKRIRAQKQVSTKAPLALAAAERLIDAGRAMPLSEGLDLERAGLAAIFATQDAQTGLSWLTHKQVGQPSFEGR